MKNLFMKFQNCNLIFVTNAQTEERMGPKQNAPSFFHPPDPKSACKVDYCITVTLAYCKVWTGLCISYDHVLYLHYI